MCCAEDLDLPPQLKDANGAVDSNLPPGPSRAVPRREVRAVPPQIAKKRKKKKGEKRAGREQESNPRAWGEKCIA